MSFHAQSERKNKMKNIPKIFKILLPILSLFGAICMNTKVGRELIGSFLEALAENRFTAQGRAHSGI
jgi:hypothetical protein